MDSAWASSNNALLDVSVDSATYFVEGAGSNKLAASGGASNQYAEFVPPGPLDLSGYDELRFWVRSLRAAAGTPVSPFFLELSYVDQNDAAGEVHRWYVPVGRRATWEHHRIGVENDRRSRIQRFRFRCLDNQPFTCWIDELLAVREQMLEDLETSIAGALTRGLKLPGVSDVSLAQNANVGDTQVVITLNQGFAAGNRVVLDGGGNGPEQHDVANVNSNVGLNRTTLHFVAGDTVVAPHVAPAGTVSMAAPVVFAMPPATVPQVSPAFVITPLGPREDMERSPFLTQRDSFRARGALTVCSVRPAPRAFIAEYQLVAQAATRPVAQFLFDAMLARLSIDTGVRVNGVQCPVWMQPAPNLWGRDIQTLGPIYIRLGSQMSSGTRKETPWVSQAVATTSLLESAGEAAAIDGRDGPPPAIPPIDSEDMVIRV